MNRTLHACVSIQRSNIDTNSNHTNYLLVLILQTILSTFITAHNCYLHDRPYLLLILQTRLAPYTTYHTYY